MEDKSLYPSLLKHEDPNVSNLAKTFTVEMGNINTDVNNYRKKWVVQEKIQQAAADFIDETQIIIDALTQRIIKENDELYELVDSL